ncbi:hypothetical protein A3C91_03820 [Candidatus Azambacteria bacterium RIFCSPHIGHO2_02_FULL_52_12]|uniref:Uncharacterized protein n=1 Tax=Candidatus Azambacteria bacterium RIFCSPLOWO2_01_FULL_46_25 TaxID=1797298 RepID=A0A1F5BTU2_9BACT|nr:MAG: hypothetical protein A3C91_03820 [Candidatus Azambacteria bacterium RIFCSPHIGHO2_02_FULL_52_12]OGD34004.1 MAG: hypothetical protein A2988_00775 [Candidatus Azambacteria bacterium RIFCSPLOWO2_01_FULL_46_25]OGD37708.1 MAG: hypothetical protein A2850_01750 [Candidatus Azambacteria bacterium RIFCSPHIGHO2_01_FULL_51_74]
MPIISIKLLPMMVIFPKNQLVYTALRLRQVMWREKGDTLLLPRIPSLLGLPNTCFRELLRQRTTASIINGLMISAWGMILQKYTFIIVL